MARKGQPRIQNRRHLAREEREQIQSNFILYATYSIIGLILIMLVYGYISTTFILPNEPVAIVNGVEISTEDFQSRILYNRYQLFGQLLRLRLQSNAPSDNSINFQEFFQQQLNQIQLQLDPNVMGNQVINDMIADQLIRQKTAELGITVSQEEIDIRLQEIYGYFGGDYAPTSTPAPTALPTSTLSPLQLSLLPPTATPAPTIIVDDVVEEPADTGTDPAEGEPEEGADSEAETVAVEEIPTVTPLPTEAPVTLEEYEGRKEELIADINIFFQYSENNLRKQIESVLYREKLIEYLTPDMTNIQEQVWARHILVPTLDVAQEVIQRLNNEESFAELAAEYSSDGSAQNGGDLGWFGPGAMVPEFEQVAFVLEIGEISEPVESQFGFHVIQILGRENRTMSASELQQAKLGIFNDWLTNELETNNANIETLDYWEERIPDKPTYQEYEAQYILDFQLQRNAPAGGGQ